MAVALDEKYVMVTDERTREENKCPALHHRWMKKIDFIPYAAPPLDTTDSAALEEWAERITFIEEDLHELLKMKHDKFWCQIVFDEKLQKLLDSYLQYAPRQYDVVFNLPQRLKALHDKVHKLIFMVYLRMSTHKESKTSFITGSVYGDILYENYLLDTAKMFDLCVLYGRDNAPLLSKMLDNVFTQQPNYEQDLQGTMPTILQVLENILAKCGLSTGSASNSPVKIDASNPQSTCLITMPLAQFQDILFYLSDTTQTLSSFLDIYPKASVHFADCDFPHRLASCYERLVPKFQEAFAERDWSDIAIHPLLVSKLREAQLCMLNSFRQMLNTLCLQPLLEEPERASEHSEQYLSMMSSLLSERRFLAHLESLFPLADDLDLMAQAGTTIDDTRLGFLQDAITDAFALYGKTSSSPQSSGYHSTSPPQKPLVEENGMNDYVAGAGAGAGAGMEGDGMNQYADAAAGGGADAPGSLKGACAREVTGIELDSLITSVKDVLAHLGDGFVERCLEEYNYSVEDVINAVLEEKLPPALKALDPNIPRRAPSPPVQEDLKSMLEHRHNIYDNDEFDVFSGAQIDLNRVHKGKKGAGELTTESVMDDKSTIRELRPLYNMYGHEDKDSMYERENPYIDTYDDEYDDTYDVNTVGADDADNADELLHGRAVTIPRVLQTGRGSRQQQEEEEDEEEEVPEQEKRRRDYHNFIEDPAAVRERQAQRWASIQANRGRGRRGGGGGGGGASHTQPQAQAKAQGQGQGQGLGQGQGQSQGQGQGAESGPKKYDVKGTGKKGQGQSEEVVRNRAFKDKHKASRANHNRKAMADRKRKV